MKIGIAGLGLIGGSLARAYHKNGAEVFGYDGNRMVQDYAKLEGTLTGALDETTISQCDLILVALFPAAATKYLQDIAPLVSKDALVMDCCGTKEHICQVGFQLARTYGFLFVGGHPMAGTQHSGYSNSRDDLFDGASMIIIPPVADDIRLLERVKKLLTPAGFAHITVTTAEHHDAMIAYTSQMCHVVSNAFVKSPTAQHHKGYSAGSYDDLTRVAWLNETMWADLFLENRHYLLHELDIFVNSLNEYRDALQSGNESRLRTLLAEGRVCKEKVDAP